MFEDISSDSDSLLNMEEEEPATIEPLINGYQLIGDSQFLRFSESLLDLKRKEKDGFSVLGLCVSGQKIEHLVRRVQNKFADVSENVVVMIGTNDLLQGTTVEKMRDDLQTLVELLSQKAKKIILLTLPPVLKLQRMKYHWDRLKEYNKYIQTLHDDEKLFVGNAYAKFVVSRESLSTFFSTRSCNLADPRNMGSMSMGNPVSGSICQADDEVALSPPYLGKRRRQSPRHSEIHGNSTPRPVSQQPYLPNSNKSSRTRRSRAAKKRFSLPDAKTMSTANETEPSPDFIPLSPMHSSSDASKLSSVSAMMPSLDSELMQSSCDAPTEAHSSGDGAISSLEGSMICTDGANSPSGDITSVCGVAVLLSGDVISPGDRTSGSGDVISPSDVIFSSDDSRFPSGNVTSPSGDVTSPSSDVTSSGDKTSLPSDTTSPCHAMSDDKTSPSDTKSPCDVILSGGVAASPSGDVKSPSGEMTFPSGDMTAPFGDRTWLSGRATSPSGEASLSTGDIVTHFGNVAKTYAIATALSGDAVSSDITTSPSGAVPPADLTSDSGVAKTSVDGAVTFFDTAETPSDTLMSCSKSLFSPAVTLDEAVSFSGGAFSPSYSATSHANDKSLLSDGELPPFPDATLHSGGAATPSGKVTSLSSSAVTPSSCVVSSFDDVTQRSGDEVTSGCATPSFSDSVNALYHGDSDKPAIRSKNRLHRKRRSNSYGRPDSHHFEIYDIIEIENADFIREEYFEKYYDADCRRPDFIHLNTKGLLVIKQIIQDVIDSVDVRKPHF